MGLQVLYPCTWFSLYALDISFFVRGSVTVRRQGLFSSNSSPGQGSGLVQLDAYVLPGLLGCAEWREGIRVGRRRTACLGDVRGKGG